MIALIIQFWHSNKQHYKQSLCRLQCSIYDESKDLESHRLSKHILSSALFAHKSSYNKNESSSDNYASIINTNNASKYSEIRNSKKIDIEHHNYYTIPRIKLHGIL